MRKSGLRWNKLVKEISVAVDFKCEHTRTSEYLLLPEDVVIRPELNGRHELPNIDWLKADILQRGQLQPVMIRSDGGQPVLAAGFSRWRAISEINAGRDAKDKLKLRCCYFRGNEADAFLANIAENRGRNGTTAIDDAYNIARLEKYGRTVAEIAAFYSEPEAWVTSRLSLVNLCPEAQAAVSDGSLKPTAAVQIAKLAEAQQREKLKGGHKLTAAGLKAESSGKPPKPTLNTLAGILRAVVDDGKYPAGFERIDSADSVGDSLAAFCTALLAMIGGKK